MASKYYGKRVSSEITKHSEILAFDSALSGTTCLPGFLSRSLFRGLEGLETSGINRTKGSNYRSHAGQFYSKRYAPGTPNPKVARFTTGKFRNDYDYKLQLVCQTKIQIRSNALEAARVAASKKLTPIGEDNFYLRVVTYPFSVNRENKLIATAGADRLQEGMRKAFGKPIGVSARVNIGSVVLDVLVKADALEKAKQAMWAASTKLPLKWKVVVVPLEKQPSTEQPEQEAEKVEAEEAVAA